MSAVIDTNVFVEAVLVDSDFHDKAERLLEKVDEWVIPKIVLYELVWVFRRIGLDSETIFSVVESVVQADKTVLVDEKYYDILRALMFIVDFKVSLSHFNDLVILYVAKSLGYPVYTFDRKMASFGKKLGVEVYLV